MVEFGERHTGTWDINHFHSLWDHFDQSENPNSWTDHEKATNLLLSENWKSGKIMCHFESTCHFDKGDEWGNYRSAKQKQEIPFKKNKKIITILHRLICDSVPGGHFWESSSINSTNGCSCPEMWQCTFPVQSVTKILLLKYFHEVKKNSLNISVIFKKWLMRNRCWQQYM